MLIGVNLITWWLARKFLRENAHLSPASQDRVLAVLAKVHQLRLARLEAAAAIAKARGEITYPLPEEQVNAPLDPCDPWHTGPERTDYTVEGNPDPSR
jgi:hypothetical protein